MDHIKRKRVVTIIFLTAAILISGIIIIMSYIMAEVQSDYHEGIDQLSSMLETYTTEIEKSNNVADATYEELLTTVKLTASALKSSDYELSPSSFQSGFIVQKTSDGSGRPEGFPEIEYDDDWLFQLGDHGISFYEDLNAMYSRITGDYFYVEFISDKDFETLGSIFDAVNPDHILSDLAQANDCDFLILGASDGDDPDDIPVIGGTGDFQPCLSTKEFGLTAEEISKSSGESFALAVINKKPYLIQSLLSKNEDTGYEMTAVMLTNAFIVLREAWSQTLSAIIIILLLCVGLAVWILSAYRMVVNKSLTYEQMERYSPTFLKSRAAVCVLAGALIVYFGALFNQSLEGMFIESKKADRTLAAYFQRMEDELADSDKVKSASRKSIYNSSTRIAELIGELSELENSAWLQEASDIIGADYIMLYDKDGNEVVSNSRYKGLTLGKKEDSATYDFRRLLRGVRYIHHENLKDEVTGLKRDYHGISVNLNADENSYGAMLTAIDTNKYYSSSLRDNNTAAASMVTPGTIIIGVNPDTGKILYSSDESFIEKNADDISAGTFPLRSNYLGYIDINGKAYYGKSSTYKNVIYYYFVEKSKMTAYSGKYAHTCAIMFLTIALILLSYLLHGYNEDKFNEYAVEELSPDEAFLQKLENRYLKNQRKASAAMFSLFRKDITPGYKALSVMGSILFVYIILIILSVYNARYTSAADSTLISYISRGDWERGFNTFSGAAILFLICAVAVFLFVLRIISIILVSLLSERSETICLLFINVLSYAALIAAVLVSLGYLGVNARAILASAGLVGLAVSLGAKDLVADILAGITTIAEGTYQIGEIIEIAGFRGEVARLGMRTTTLVGRGKNIKTFRNSSIGDVINYSKMNSWYPLKLTFPNTVHISEVEKILNDELPNIGVKYPEIISGPEYRGIDAVESDKTTIVILTECRQTDYSDVQLNVNREVLHILKSHNIAVV